MTIIEERETHKDIEHCLSFQSIEDRGASYSFVCNEDGTLKPFAFPQQAESYAKAQDRSKYRAGVLETRFYRYVTCAVGRCECGQLVDLEHFTNTCRCGRDYNSFGQLLAPREQWGEETGEHWTECF